MYQSQYHTKEGLEGVLVWQRQKSLTVFCMTRLGLIFSAVMALPASIGGVKWTPFPAFQTSKCIYTFCVASQANRIGSVCLSVCNNRNISTDWLCEVRATFVMKTSCQLAKERSDLEYFLGLWGHSVQTVAYTVLCFNAGTWVCCTCYPSGKFGGGQGASKPGHFYVI